MEISAIISKTIAVSIAASIALHISSHSITQRWFKKRVIKDDDEEEQTSTLQQQGCDYDRFDRLPSEVLVIILSKLDIVTLCRCTAASPKFHPLLRMINSLSFDLPASLLLPDRNKFLHGLRRRFINYVHDKLDCFLGDGNGSELWIRFGMRLERVINSLFQELVSGIGVSDSRILFMSNFSRLDTMVIRLPPPPLAADHLTAPDSWFRWDAMAGKKDYYILSVHATIVNNDGQEEQRAFDPNHDARTKSQVAYRHLNYHLHTVCSTVLPYLIDSNPKYKGKHSQLRTLVSEDISKHGRLVVYTDSSTNKPDKELKYRCLYVYLPEKLVLKASGSNVTIKDAWLWFQSRSYIGHIGNDGSSIKVQDIIFSLVERGLDHNPELQEAVLKILQHGEILDVYPFDEATPRNYMRAYIW